MAIVVPHISVSPHVSVPEVVIPHVTIPEAPSVHPAPSEEIPIHPSVVVPPVVYPHPNTNSSTTVPVVDDPNNTSYTADFLALGVILVVIFSGIWLFKTASD